MKAVIDVGSNSVRLLLQSTTGEKFIKITKLAEGLNATGKLSDVAIKRTVSAVAFFKEKAIECNAESINIFATSHISVALIERFLQYLIARRKSLLRIYPAPVFDGTMPFISPISITAVLVWSAIIRIAF